MSGSALRVLLVADYEDDPMLGSAKVAHKLRGELQAAGHQCDILFSGSIGRAPSGRQVRQLVAPMLAAGAVSRAVSRKDFDVIDAASAEGLWVAAARRLGRYGSAAVICRSNGLEHLNYQRMLDDSRAGLLPKPWTKRVWYPASRLTQVAGAARLSDRLIVLNDADRQFAVSRGWKSASRIDVVPHGVDDRFLDPASPAGPRGGGILFCGSWDLVKGTPYLCAAFDQLVESGAAARLTVLGPGVAPSTVLSSFSERSRPLVTVTGRVAEDRVIEAYRRHDLLVFPSTYEGFGLVALEAMSQGLPVVATPVGCVAGLVRDGDNGLLVPPRDSRMLAAAIRRLLDCPTERARIGAAAAASVRGMTWRRTADQTVAVYRQALEAVRQ